MKEQVEMIIDAVCRYSGVSHDELIGRNRKQFMVAVRSVTIKLLKELTCYSNKQIGAIFGVTDMTVTYHTARHEYRMGYERSYRMLYEQVREAVYKEIEK